MLKFQQLLQQSKWIVRFVASMNHHKPNQTVMEFRFASVTFFLESSSFAELAQKFKFLENSCMGK